MTDHDTSGMTLDNIEGMAVIGSDGDKLGTVADVYYDKATRQPEWALVNTGFFGMKSSFVPLTSSTQEGDSLKVPFTKQQVRDAPNLDDDGELSQDEERMLSEHYGISYSEAPSSTGLPGGGGGEGKPEQRTGRGTGDTVARDTSGRETDSAMTRSEEEVDIQKTRRPSELVRLRKEIVTEQVQMTVPVEKEVLRVERESITDANRDDAMSGEDLTTEEAEITLTQEEVDVTKRVVPKERVRLEKDVVTEDRQVEEEVRKEQIEVERAGQTQSVEEADTPKDR